MAILPSELSEDRTKGVNEVGYGQLSLLNKNVYLHIKKLQVELERTVKIAVRE